jgi:cytochrome P450
MPLFPALNKSLKFQQAAIEMFESRVQLGKSRLDVFSHFLEEDTEKAARLTHSELAANARLLIIAGADTTSSTITCILRELALNPEIRRKLYMEISEAIKNVAVFDCKNTKDLPYLQAVIKEGSRLWNAVPMGAEAVTGPDGATVAGQYIPPRTAVRVPHYTLMTDNHYFSEVNVFLP